MIPDDNSVELRTLPLDHRSSFVRRPEDGETIQVLTRECDVMQELRMLVPRIRKIIETDGDLFKYIPLRRGFGHRIEGESQFTMLMASLHRDWGELYALFPHHSFNPYVTLFLETYKGHKNLEELVELYPKVPAALLPVLFQHLQVFVQDLRQRGRSKEFRDVLHRIARRCRKNYRALLRYVRKIFEAGSRQLVIRLDLSWGTADTVAPSEDVSLADVRRCLARLQRYLRDTFPLTGFAWKLEYGLLKGHHYHVLIFLNGHVVREDLTIGRQIKHEWEDVITEGRGACFLCNELDYGERGVGMINYFDQDKMDILERNVLPYLVKADFWMSYEPGGRTFGKGVMPPGAPSVGRPRSRRHSRRGRGRGVSDPR